MDYIDHVARAVVMGAVADLLESDPTFAQRKLAAARHELDNFVPSEADAAFRRALAYANSVMTGGGPGSVSDSEPDGETVADDDLGLSPKQAQLY
jgi:hypothetical protein